jgi:hypothetical protein
VIAVENGWASRLLDAALNVHVLAPAGFTMLDPVAGDWVSQQAVPVHEVRSVDDCFAALAERDVELRLTPSLWLYVDAVRASAEEFSAIRMRNARPRDTVGEARG